MGAKLLTQAGTLALADVTRLDAERRRLLAEAEADAAALIAERMRGVNLAVGEAVHRALAEGVPHTRVSREGMSTSDWDIVDEFAALHVAERAA